MSVHGRPSEQQSSVTKKISSSLNKELQDLQNLSEDCSIYHVPQRFREVDGKVYTPKVVSISPIHHGKKELMLMEEHKRRYLRHFLQLGNALELHAYVDFLRGKETQIRNCYSEAIHLDTEEFIKMILIDATFLILLSVQSSFQLDITADRIFKKPRMMDETNDDILLLENQIPFFVLQDLFELAKLPAYFRDRYGYPEEPNIIKLAYKFFEKWINCPKITRKIDNIQAEHLLHFLRIFYVPQTWHLKRKKVKNVSMPSAMELYQAGVKFKLGSSENLFDINFRDGILEIPRWILYDSTVIIFHNLCAYEECHHNIDKIKSYGHTILHNQECHCLSNLISDYIVVMNELVKSSRDVELLIQKGIIVNNAFSNKGVARFFRKLDAGVHVFKSHFSYGCLMEDLNKHCDKRWPRWKATLKEDYFKNPWAGISASAAAILVLLAVIQTICSILQVKNQK